MIIGFRRSIVNLIENKKVDQVLMLNSYILLILLSIGLLISSYIIGIIGIIKDFKKKTHQYFIFIIFVCIIMILLIPVIFGLIQDLNS